MKKLALLAPALSLGAMGGCASSDLAAFAEGLSMAAAQLDAELNPPCPPGMYRPTGALAQSTPSPVFGVQGYGYGTVYGLSGYDPALPARPAYAASYSAPCMYYPVADRPDRGRRDAWRDGYDTGYEDGYYDGYDDGYDDASGY